VAGRDGGIRVVEGSAPAGDTANSGGAAAPESIEERANSNKPPLLAEPVGTSHFESPAPITVARGSSAMLAFVERQTEGDVVYFYDPDGPRGNSTFPFRALLLKNPTDSTLESGPVTVFGEGRFVGEGLCDPIPAHSTAFVPFALDRQIIVERRATERDAIARILKVQRGIFSTEMHHIRRTRLSLVSRLAKPAKVYLRHVVGNGCELTEAPPNRERLGGAYLFRVELPQNGRMVVDIEEAASVERSADVSSPEGMHLVRTYLATAAGDGGLRDRIDELKHLDEEAAATESCIATARDKMNEHRGRMAELQAQIVTLRGAKTAAPVLRALEKKVQEFAERIAKATVEIAALQERALVARSRFQDRVSDLQLPAQAER
jgi:hypothetical protein